MRPPRMTAGVLADETDDVELGHRLAAAGHEVEWLDDPAEVVDKELVVVSVTEAALPEVVEALSLRARRGQIFVHTQPGHGVQIFDPLELSGAIVLAAYPLNERIWATSAADELGETIVELIVGEIGGQSLVIPDGQRARLAAALTYLGFIGTVRNDAFVLLAEALGNEEKALEIADEASGERALPAVTGDAGVSAQQRAIEDPGTARSFRELARRAAEQTGAQDVELWAIQEERQ